MATDPVRLSARVVASAISGVVWAGIAILLIPHGPGIGPPISSALMAAPVIGIAVGLIATPFFRAMGRWGKVLVGLMSLYVAVGLFGLAIPFGVPGGLNSAEHFLESVIVLWIGLTISGMFAILWPLAVMNFQALSWLDRKLTGRDLTPSQIS